MTRLWPNGEPVEVETDAFQQPMHFTWQAKRHSLRYIQQRWEIDTDWWSEQGRVHRAYYAVITDDSLLCVLYHDHLDGTWYLAKLYD